MTLRIWLLITPIDEIVTIPASFPTVSQPEFPLADGTRRLTGRSSNLTVLPRFDGHLLESTHETVGGW